MRNVARCALLLVFACCAVLSAADTESQITAVLNVQVDAWNRGDISAFVTTYADDCTFVGKQVAHGREQVLARYQKAYPTREAMGHLSFSGLAVHPLSDDIAVVTGEWHLERSGGAGNVGGLFSLVLQRGADGWKIMLDHTS